MLMITGPQCSFANLPVVIEELVELIGRMIDCMQKEGLASVVAAREGAQKWTSYSAEVTEPSLLREGASVSSWIVGANVAKRHARPVNYVGGATAYFGACHRQVATGVECVEFGPVGPLVRR